MFEASLDDINMLRDSIATIADIIDETEIRIKEKGIEMMASDRAVVAVVDFMLSRSVFSEYKFESEQKIGINLVSLLQILKRAKSDDKLRLKLEANKLHITLMNGSRRVFTLPLIDVSKEEPPPLDTLQFPSHLRISSEILNSGIEDAELVGDSIILTANKGNFLMKAESDNSSSLLELQPGNGMKIVDMGEPVRARYSLDYLKKMIKARKLADEATILMGTDYPLKMQFEVPGKLSLGFVLAPRVDE
jgi:proliferating cell nuclear antigen